MANTALLSGLGAGLQAFGGMMMDRNLRKEQGELAAQLKQAELAAEQQKREFDLKNRAPTYQTFEDTGPDGATIKRTVRSAYDPETGAFGETEIGSAAVPVAQRNIDPLSEQGLRAQMEIERQKAVLRPKGEGRQPSEMERRLELARSLGANEDQLRSMVLGTKTSGQSGGLPAPALKMQQTEIDALNSAGNINSALDNIVLRIDSGALNLGPMSNVISKARNAAGLSSEESKNFASLQSTLEKLRNDSLRLNSGVQTEGDAQRAMNELITNINDPSLVKQRVQEIKALNERAVAQRTENVNRIRQNYGLDPLDSIGQLQTPETDAINAGREAASEVYGDNGGRSPNIAAAPSLEQFLAAAKLANPTATENDLIDFYQKKYGAR